MGDFFSPRPVMPPTQTVWPIHPGVERIIDPYVDLLLGIIQSPPAPPVSPGLIMLPEFMGEVRKTLSGERLASAPPPQLPPVFVPQNLPPGMAGPFAAQLAGTLSGQPLNPFYEAFLQAVESQGEQARRQLAAQAQRAGMLTSTEYANLARDLESRIAEAKQRMLGELYESERERQMRALGEAAGIWRQMMEQGVAQAQLAAAQARAAEEMRQQQWQGERERQTRLVSATPDIITAATRAAMAPYEFMLGGLSTLGGLVSGLLGSTRGETIVGSVQPSPFASILGAISPFAPFLFPSPSPAPTKPWK